MSLKIELANAITGVVQRAAAEYVHRERAGSSASMNGALEYLELDIVEAMLPLVIERCAGWHDAETARINGLLKENMTDARLVALMTHERSAAAIRQLGSE